MPQLKLQSTSLTNNDIYPFHRPFSGQKGISKVKRNERMGKRPNQNRVLAKYPCHRHPPHTPLTVVQPYPLHTRLPLSSLRSFSLYMQNRREEGEVPSSTNLHPIPALIRSSTSSFLHHHSPRRWLKNFLFPNPILAYLASRTSRYPHADGRRALAFPRFAFVRETASSLS